MQVRREEPSCRRHDAGERRVVERIKRGDRIDTLQKADLATVDVADPGQRPLVQQGVSDRDAFAADGPQARHGLL